MYHQITRNKRMSILVVVLFLLFWLLAGFLIGSASGSLAGAIVGTVVLGLLAVGAGLYSYFLGAATVLAVSGARAADPQQFQQLHNIVETLAIGDGLPKPQVYVIDDPSPNAFATGRNPQHAAVTVTTGLLQMMNREELEGVLSHEMSHIKNFDVRLILILATMVGLAGLLASFVWRAAFTIRTRDFRVTLVILAIGLVFGIIAVIVGPLMQMALSRQRESLADASGVELTRNPTGLISALKKISMNDKPLQRFNHATAAMCIDNPSEHHGSFWGHLFDTHPPVQERIAALEKIFSVKET
ncbi:MAG TPA: M48 family metallopeptidase [Candidatus Acidoferrales bacterium]|nr:M48 family metallopeptidase [Candidatus Acidoferrales bacterium]